MGSAIFALGILRTFFANRIVYCSSFKICKRLRGSRQISRQKLSFDNELGSGNLLKIRGWTSQLVVINSSEHWWGHHLCDHKYANYLPSFIVFVNELEQ